MVKSSPQFRHTSSHSYNIETGRHGHKRNSIVNRLCPNCSQNADNTMTLLAELPFFEPILENEFHILIYCPSYSVLRDNLKNASKTALQDDLKSLFHSAPTIRAISNFLKKAHDRRFPERCKNIKHKSTQTENQWIDLVWIWVCVFNFNYNLMLPECRRVCFLFFCC